MANKQKDYNFIEGRWIKIKVLFTLKFSEEEFKRIRDLGYEVVFNSEGNKSTLDKMTDEELKSIDVLVTYNSFTKLDISKMKNLLSVQYDVCSEKPLTTHRKTLVLYISIF